MLLPGKLFLSLFDDKYFNHRACIVIVSIFITFILMQNATGTHATKILQPLSNFPRELGQWKLINTRASSQGIIDMLGVNDYIDYTYQDNKDNQINFYVGYYESVGTTGSYHSPKNCLPGSGWGIDQAKAIQIIPYRKTTLNQTTPVNISEMLIRNGDQYQVVIYWFQNRGRIIASEYWEKIYLVFDALTVKRRDGSFVRLMMEVPDNNIKKAEALLIDFSRLVIPLLDNFIPGSDLRVFNTEAKNGQN